MFTVFLSFVFFILCNLLIFKSVFFIVLLLFIKYAKDQLGEAKKKTDIILLINI